MTVFLTRDEKVGKYLNSTLQAVRKYLKTGQINKLYFIIQNDRTKETIERWQFNITTDTEENKENKENQGNVDENGAMREKQVKKKVNRRKLATEIARIIRQITTATTILPVIQECCTFDVLLSCEEDIELSPGWGETEEAKITIDGVGEETSLPFASLDTKIHKVESAVSYKVVDDICD